VGCLAAMEAVKVLGGFGEPLTNQLLTFDLRSMRFTKLVIEKREGCRVCGSDRS
jgi:molybdopterin/thiamine biosynthesis adenylyltransferase